MSNTRDGGRSSLAGYLYQIVGVLGMRAWAHCSDASSGSEELEALLTLVGSGELYHEHLDQDAVIQQLGIERDDECVLVQFKFSRQVPPPTIGPSKLLDIVDALHSAAERASEHGRNVTGYALVSNRQLGPGAKKLREAAQQGVDDPRLTTRKYRSSILQKLRVIAELHRSEWDEALERFAHRFGADEEREIEEGIDLIIGRVIRQTAERGDARVTKADLTEAFTGCRDARPLTSESVAEHSAGGVNDFPVNVPPAPVRRQLLDAISEAVSERRALVVLHGLGGCGKTVALWQWAQELITSLPPGTGAFTTIRLARDIPRSWIAEVISEWGNLSRNHPRRSEQPERALNRLGVANPGVAPPIMHLGLDGLDEETGNVEQEHIVKKTLRWFWKEDKASRQKDRPPQAILVVTCRDADLVQEWLCLDASGFGYPGEPPWGVEVDIFSSEELLEAAQKTGRRELHDRIKATLQLVGGGRLQSAVSGYEPLALGPLLPSMPAADVQILEALKHPAMWRALLELQSLEVQLRVLDGETQAIRQLAEVFVQRFCRKVVDRGRVADLREDALLCMLCAIARHCRSNGRVCQSLPDWFEPVCGTEILSRSEARTFYSEALSGGMVSEDDPRHWRWCHRLIWDYLAEVDMPWLRM